MVTLPSYHNASIPTGWYLAIIAYKAKKIRKINEFFLFFAVLYMHNDMRSYFA